MKRFCLAALLLLTTWVAGDSGDRQFAYIGPGAGFAFLGSFLTLLSGLVMSIGSMLLWPVRVAWRVMKRRRGFRKARIKRAIFLGLDGLDPRLTERYMEQGKLPNLSRLREQGSYHRLRTTFPALSPVAWATFATGVNPARHNIFDFLNRSLKTYLPELAAARVHQPRRVLKLGKLRIPLSNPEVEMRRKSQPFWNLLGEQFITSTIVRVPITFPPDRFHGRMLSAMSTPDLRGTQGSFSLFSTQIASVSYEGGSRYPLRRANGGLEGNLEGPQDTFSGNRAPLLLPFRIRLDGGKATLDIDGQRHSLQQRQYSPWLRLRFRSSLGVSVYGIARFLLLACEPECSIYVTPIHIDPEKPALPVSYPAFYAAYLAKLFGSYGTLGMAEDTWALNEKVIDEHAFLDQAYSLMAEREAMFRNALEKTPNGVVACVFDTSDRVQHMFFRHLENGGPHANVIEDLYQRMDSLVGLAASHAGPDTALFVLSDHGFCSFRRGVNLNTWLLRNGYLALKDGSAQSGPYFKDVDWSRTRAYSVGLAGLYLNMKDREAQGIVSDGEEAETLRQELIKKLGDLRDSTHSVDCIRAVYASNAIYRGPYLPNAPDLIVGFHDGYRISWDGAIGAVSSEIFEDNVKAWSGDHAVDPALVPGVLFCNRPLHASNPGIEDMAPTVLSLFGLPPPQWMEGKPLFHDAA